MKTVAERTATQVRQNYEAFHEQLPALLAEHRGQYALMKDGQVVGIFNSAIEAYIAGQAQLGLGNFSMQKIVDEPVDLGYFSHGLH
jgi:hypothetical protein